MCFYIPQEDLGLASPRSSVLDHNGRSKSEHCILETLGQQQHQPPVALHLQYQDPDGETPPEPFCT